MTETRTGCCVVGGGPAGLMLGYLLARKEVPVVVLEAHRDFDRDFRGDTINPNTLEVMDQLGLAERLLQIPHTKLRTVELKTPERTFRMSSLEGLKTRFPFVAILPQARLLELLAEDGRRLPQLDIRMGARVGALVEEGGAVRGVRYRGADDAEHEVRAALTVGADGRFSKVRQLAGFEPIRNASPMDVVWFRLPRRSEDSPDQGGLYVHGGRFAVVRERGSEWQVAYIILKGSYTELRAAGLEALWRGVAEVVPFLADRVSALADWKQTSMLSVESNRLRRWHKPGLLFVGDAAHAMSPVLGVGVNCAVQDAVEAANVLWRPIAGGNVEEAALAAFQKRREWPIRIVQAFQGMMQRRIAAPALNGNFRPPAITVLQQHFPFLRRLPGLLVAFGARRVRVET